MGRYDRLTETAAQTKLRLLTNALTQACEISQPETIPRMLEKCPEAVNTPDDEGNYAVHVAAKHGSVACLQLVLDAGAQVNVVNTDGLTALHLGCRWGKAEAVKKLVQQNVNKHARCPRNYTPMHEAAEHGHEPALRELVANKDVDPLLRNENEKTPREITSAWGRKEIRDFIFQYESMWFSTVAVTTLKLRKDPFSWIWSLPRTLLRGRVFDYLRPNQWSVEEVQEQLEELGEPLEVDATAQDDINVRPAREQKSKPGGAAEDETVVTQLGVATEGVPNGIQDVAKDQAFSENPVEVPDTGAEDGLAIGVDQSISSESLKVPDTGAQDGHPQEVDQSISSESLKIPNTEVEDGHAKGDDETVSSESLKGLPILKRVASARKMDKACAAVLEAQKQFANFQRRDMFEVRRMNVPTDAVRLVLEAACLIVYWPTKEEKVTGRKGSASSRQKTFSRSRSRLSSEFGRESNEGKLKTPRTRVTSDQNLRPFRDNLGLNSATPEFSHDMRKIQAAFQALRKGRGQWEDTRQLFSQPDFHNMILNYDPERFLNGRDLVDFLGANYISNPKFTHEAAKKGSLVCGALFKWIHGLLLMMENTSTEQRALLDQRNAGI